jgi:ATPase family associated with various cellular activities (AAA)
MIKYRLNLTQSNLFYVKYVKLPLFWNLGSCRFFFSNSPYSVHRAHAGESEKFLREAFSEAHSHAVSGKPSVIFIDEIDSICPRRNDKYVSKVMAHYYIIIFWGKTTGHLSCLQRLKQLMHLKINNTLNLALALYLGLKALLLLYLALALGHC